MSSIEKLQKLLEGYFFTHIFNPNPWESDFLESFELYAHDDSIELNLSDVQEKVISILWDRYGEKL